MKVSKNWLHELVDLKVPVKGLTSLIPMRTIGIKETTDDFIELDMKGYNRADLLSMRGVAREIAAITNSAVSFKALEAPKTDLPETQVKVVDGNLCPVYCIAKIEGLKVESSNPEWKKKLENSGMRSVNNIADVTNLIMLEYGQPMHAFDARGVKDETLIVRLARQDERLTTLDGKIRDLDISDLLIADPQNALGLAGVMGGKDSEVSDLTTTILLEAAIFDPISIRKTSQRHGLHSEASKRFQHGLTKTNLLQALSAAIKMYEDLGGKLTAISLVGSLEDTPKTVHLTQQKVNDLIGIEIPSNQVEASLKKLEFSLASQGDAFGAWEVTVPYWRLDINIEEDLVEEVARMYGYEKIPPQELRGKQPSKIDQKLPNYIYDLKVALKDAGFTEVQTYSFFSSKVINDLNSKINDLTKISNPISSETQYMRDYIWPNLVEVVEKNLKQGYKDIAVFEVGKVYVPQKDGLPKETYHIAIAFMNGTDNPVKELFVILSEVKNLYPSPSKPDQDNKNIFHPTRFATFSYNNQNIGYIAEVHPKILNKFGIGKRVAILELNIEQLLTS